MVLHNSYGNKRYFMYMSHLFHKEKGGKDQATLKAEDNSFAVVYLYAHSNVSREYLPLGNSIQLLLWYIYCVQSKKPGDLYIYYTQSLIEKVA